jgi:HPt (histidine-containing phosphotransfer) domain-containing protein
MNLSRRSTISLPERRKHMGRDLSRQDSLLNKDPVGEEILEFRSLYIDYLRGEIDTLRSLLVRKDLAEIREVGHRLKGSGGSYGFHHISELGEEIQNLSDRIGWDEIETLFHRLEETYEEIAEGL